MTESDVEKVVGLPPGNYCTDDQITETFYQYYVDRPLPDLPHKEWMSDGGMIQIIFKDGKVMRKSFYAPILPRRSWLEQIRDRLGL